MRLDEAQAGIKIARRTNNNLRYADDTIFMAKSEELKGLLIKVKGFGIVNKAEIDVFFWNSLAFSMIQWMLAI